MNEKELKYINSNMRKVPKNIFEPGQLVPCDAFIKLGNNNFIRIAKKGVNSFVHEFNFFAGPTNFLYIEKENYGALVDNQFNELDKHVDFENSFLDSSRRVLHLFEAVLSDLYDGEHTEEAISRLQLFNHFFVEMAERNKDFSVLSKLVNEESALLSKHSFLVTSLSILIAMKSDSIDSQDFNDLIMGAYLHDIGIIKLPKEIDRNLESLKEDELRQYQAHPEIGADFVKTFKSIPKSVVQIIRQHHENEIGQGFPNKIAKDEITKFSKIVGLCEIYVELITAERSSQSPLRPTNAIHYISNILGQPYDDAFFDILKKIAQSSSL